MKVKRMLVCSLLMGMMLLSIASPALASPAIEPLSAKSCSAHFSPSGKTVSFGLDGYGSTVESISGTAYLQEYRGGKWVTVSTATGPARNASSIRVRKTFTVTGGYSYRVTASCTAGGVTKSDTSATKSL